MPYGLSQETLDRIQAVFVTFAQVERAVLYGSRAKGTHKHGSDIDISLYGKDLTVGQCFTIGEALEQLDLPYSIDLSLFATIEHGGLREHIERVGVVIYERGS